MKEYVKPTLDVVELRLEERIARCFDQPNTGNDGTTPGDGPGVPGNCPGGS